MLDRFRRSAQIDADNWRDPQYDLDAIRHATPQEKAEIEQFLCARGIGHPCDVEALALLDTPKAREALLAVFREGKVEIRAAVAHFAAKLIDKQERMQELLERIATCDAYQGLSFTLEQILADHPQEVIDAMLRRIVLDPGVAAVHYVALLFFLSGITNDEFDWQHRPFFLRFNPGDDLDRKAAFLELCERINQDSCPYNELWSPSDSKIR